MNPQTRPKILVTGATGFVGYHLSKALLQQNFEVVGIARRKPHEAHLQQLPITWAIGDVQNKIWLQEQLRDVQTVFHCAAQIRASNLEDLFQTNLEWTKILYQACLNRQNGTTQFIFLSSCAASGPNNNEVAKTEEQPATPVSWYGKSKWEAEQALWKLSSASAPLTIVRPAMVYGPYDQGMLPLFKMVKNRLNVYTGNAHGPLSLISIDDCVQALTALINNPRAHNQTYHLAHPQTLSLIQIGQTMQQAMNLKWVLNLRIPVVVAELCALITDTLNKKYNFRFMLTRDKVTESLQRSWHFDGQKIVADTQKKFNYQQNHLAGFAHTIKAYHETGWL